MIRSPLEVISHYLVPLKLQKIPEQKFQGLALVTSLQNHYLAHQVDSVFVLFLSASMSKSITLLVFRRENTTRDQWKQPAIQGFSFLL